MARLRAILRLLPICLPHSTSFVRRGIYFALSSEIISLPSRMIRSASAESRGFLETRCHARDRKLSRVKMREEDDELIQGMHAAPGSPGSRDFVGPLGLGIRE